MWADQKGRGTHVNLSGIGVVKGTDKADEAKELVRYLTEPKEQRMFAQNNHEFGVAPGRDTTPEIKQFGDFKRDPIDVAGAGAAPRRRRADDERRGVGLSVAAAGRGAPGSPPGSTAGRR